MPRFKFLVVETTANAKVYEVEAEDILDARYKAEIGDTISETLHGSSEGVLERTILEEF